MLLDISPWSCTPNGEHHTNYQDSTVCQRKNLSSYQHDISPEGKGHTIEAKIDQSSDPNAALTLNLDQNLIATTSGTTTKNTMPGMTIVGPFDGPEIFPLVSIFSFLEYQTNVR
jgi:hypothetical protein